MTRHRPAVLRVAALAVAGCLLAACSGGPRPGAGTPGASGAPSGDLTVVAAASLTDVLQEIGDRFEAEHEGVTVTFSFGSSSGLAQQLRNGALADVYAAASPETMEQVTGAGLVAGEPTAFARNRLQLAVPAGNPGGVSGLEDLAREDLVVALCAAEVPCGAASARVLEAAGVTPAPDTYERDVRATLTKVRLGEVDAALVYRTDVLAAGGDVEGIDVPGAAEAANDYQVAVLDEAGNPTAAEAFVEFLRSAAARRVLADAGFDLP